MTGIGFNEWSIGRTRADAKTMTRRPMKRAIIGPAELLSQQQSLDSRVRAWITERQGVPVALWSQDDWADAEYVPTRVMRKGDRQPPGIAWRYEEESGLVSWIPESGLAIPTGEPHVTTAARFLAGVMFDIENHTTIVAAGCKQKLKDSRRRKPPAQWELRVCECGTSFQAEIGRGHERKFCSDRCRMKRAAIAQRARRTG
jgi:hypothetical protein